MSETATQGELLASHHVGTDVNSPRAFEPAPNYPIAGPVRAVVPESREREEEQIDSLQVIGHTLDSLGLARSQPAWRENLKQYFAKTDSVGSGIRSEIERYLKDETYNIGSISRAEQAKILEKNRNRENDLYKQSEIYWQKHGMPLGRVAIGLSGGYPEYAPDFQAFKKYYYDDSEGYSRRKDFKKLAEKES